MKDRYKTISIKLKNVFSLLYSVLLKELIPHQGFNN